MRFYPRTPAGIVMMAAGIAVATPALRAQALQTGIISGTVTVSGGGSAKGVQITLTDTGRATTTDERGFFVFTSVLPGIHDVEASLVGYEPALEEGVAVTQELTTTVNLTLEKQKAQSFGESVVRLPMIRKDVPSTVYTVTAEQEQLVRGTPDNLYQYPGAAISQPGVVPDPNGFPSIRGGRTFNTGYMLDGILLTQPSSGQFATNLVTVGMGRMNVYTGGMRADLGGATGGFINSVIKTGASVRGGSIETSAGSLTYGNLVAEAGNVEKNGLNWYAATNMFRTDVKLNAGYDEIPASADGIVKLIKPLGQKGRLTFLGAQGSERYNIPLIDPFTGRWLDAEHTLEYNNSRTPSSVSTPTNPWTSRSVTRDYLNQRHLIGSLTWAHSFTPASTLSAQVYGWQRKKNINAMSEGNLLDDRTNDALGAGKLDYTTQLSERLQVRLGGEVLRGNNFDRRALVAQSEIGPDAGMEGPTLRIRNADTTDFNRYLAITAKPSARLTADLGIRYDSRTYHRSITASDITTLRDEEINQIDIRLASGLSNAVEAAADREAVNDVAEADLQTLRDTRRNPRYSAVSPRLGLAYAVNPSTVLKLSAGRYHQFSPSNYIENSYLPIYFSDGTGDPFFAGANARKVFDVGPETSDGFDVSLQHQFRNNVALELTPYWRRMKDMIGKDPASGAFGNGGHGRVHGVESKLMLGEHSGFSGWLTYTYQVAKGNIIVADSAPTLKYGDREFRLNYDQRHTVYLVGNYRSGQFEVNPMLELGSGYPYGDGTRYVKSVPVLVDGHVASADVNTYNTGWHKNLSVTFRWYPGESKSSYYFLQIQNVLNSDDIIYRSRRNPFTNATSFGYSPDVIPYTDENGKTTGPDGNPLMTTKGYYSYRPAVRVPPIFFLVGVRKAF